MENQAVLIIGLAFVAALGFILRQANAPAAQKQIKEKPTRQPKPQKTKKPAQKKSQKKGAQVTEWVGVDTAAKDAQDMLEFLKGRDPKEISKVLKSQNPKPKAQPQPAAPVVQQNNKKGKNQKQAQNDSANEVHEEGYSVIQKKAPKVKKDKKNKNPKEEEKDEQRTPRVKSFFKAEEDEIQKLKKERAEARAKGEKGEKRDRPREDRPKRERKEKKEGEESANESDSGAEKPRPKRERREKPEGEQSERPPRTIVAPNVPKYELPDINDMLNSITKDYKAKPATAPVKRESSLFSKIPRQIVVDRILTYLNARDLIRLSQVNQYFKSAAKKESLWRSLYVKEFGTENIEGVKSFLREYRKRKSGKGGNKPNEKKQNTPKQQ